MRGMVNTISFMSANYVARQLDYRMTEGWGQGDAATNTFFRPLETFEERFREILRDVRALGFEAIDLWLAHLHPTWATEDHVRIARDLLAEHELKVVSLAGGFGNDRETFAKSCRLAAALDTSILGGNTALVLSDRGFVIDTLEEHALVLGIENHPERTPTELRARLGEAGDGSVAVALDTGWFGTHGYDAATAIRELQDVLVHVHLKDVLERGSHDTCRFGLGVVPIEACVRALREIDYGGAISIEHEPADADPTEDVVASLHLLRKWLR